MKNVHVNTLPKALAVGIATIIASLVAAPLQAKSIMEEVIVTAQKREQNVQDVPISLSVASKEQLARQGINEFTDLAYISPALEMSDPGQSPGGGAVIRGLGTASFTSTAEAAVGLVVDGVPQGSIPNLNLYDIQRVEVLRGPQGMLFGQSASAGVINMITVAPDTESTEFILHGEYADKGTAGSKYGQQIVHAIANIPLADNAALRLSTNYNLREGVQRNVSKGKDTEYDKKGFRGRLFWAPTENLDVNLALDYNKEERDGAEFFVQTSVLPGDTSFDACGISVSESNQDYCETIPEFNTIKNFGGSLQLDWDLNGYNLTSITARRSQEEGPSDASILRNEFGGFWIRDFDSQNEAELFSQEFRITSPIAEKLDYVAGVFYSDYETEDNTPPTGGSTVSGLVPVAPGVVIEVPFAMNDGFNNDSTIKTKAVFGQATYHISDEIDVFAGMRYTDIEVFNRQSLIVDPQQFNELSVSDDAVTWRLGGQYRFNSDTMAYASVATGYKGPQINNQDIDNDPFVVKPEEPTSIEAGVKTSVMDGRLGLDFNVFYTKVKNYQAQICGEDSNQQLVCSPDNVPEVKSKGFEIDIFGSPLDGLSLTGGMIYADTVYPSGYLNESGEDIGGRQIAFAPEWKFLISGEYTQSLSDNIDGFVALDTVYKTKQFLNTPDSNAPDFEYPAHWLVGSQIGIRTKDDRYSVALFGRNLTNENVPFVIFGGTGDNISITGNASYRLLGVKFDAKF